MKHYCPKCGSILDSLQKCTNLTCDYQLFGTNTIDISYKAKGIAKALSNLAPYPFTFDDVLCSSMESFIQSLKVQDINVQKDICAKSGLFCNSIKDMFGDWRENQIVFWKGKAIKRDSEGYIELIQNAYDFLYIQSPLFRFALRSSKGYNLIHSIGLQDKTQTLLTEEEFISILDNLRDKIL